jgi:hypothetical protein
VQIRYRHISGCCARCAGVEFERLSPATDRRSLWVLRCMGCGAATRYGEVTCRIGDEAVREARAAMRALQERYQAQRARLARLREGLADARMRARAGADQREQQVVERHHAGDLAAEVDNRKRIAA